MASDSLYIDDSNSTTPTSYINQFLEHNNDNLKSIYDTNSVNKEGFLFLDCNEADNKVEVAFLESNHYNTIVTDTEKYKDWGKVKSEANDNKIYIIRDNTYKLIIILYI